MSETTATVINLSTKTLPKTTFDHFLDSCIKLLPLVTFAAATKFVFRSNRV